MKKFLFILLGLVALNVVQAQITSGTLKLTSHTKPNPMGDAVKEFLDRAWMDFIPAAEDPAASVVVNREKLDGYITLHAEQGIEYARLYNGAKAINCILNYCKTLDVESVKSITGLGEILAGVDLRLKDVAYYNPLSILVEDYFQLKNIISGMSVAEARGSMMFSTLVLSLGGEEDYKRYREILELGNTTLTLEYLECLKYVFMFNGYTKGMHELRPYVEKLMPVSELKTELMKAYDTYYAFRDGLPAPEFDMQGYDEQNYTLKDFRGKVLVIDVWASWCGGCVKKLPAFMEVAKAYEGRDDIEFITISIDRPDAVKVWKQMVEKHKLSGLKNLIMGAKTDFKPVYNIQGIPRYIVIDKEGVNVTLYAPSPDNVEFRRLIDKTLNK